jgi:hypothetical protein
MGTQTSHWIILTFETSPEDADCVALSFLAAVHLALIAVSFGLLCLGFRWWKRKKEKASERLILS